ncbi:MAG: hypothetical protein R3C56_29460 [Pirellulaceae bacterium]
MAKREAEDPARLRRPTQDPCALAAHVMDGDDSNQPYGSGSDGTLASDTRLPSGHATEHTHQYRPAQLDERQ